MGVGEKILHDLLCHVTEMTLKNTHTNKNNIGISVRDEAERRGEKNSQKQNFNFFLHNALTVHIFVALVVVVVKDYYYYYYFYY